MYNCIYVCINQIYSTRKFIISYIIKGLYYSYKSEYKIFLNFHPQIKLNKINLKSVNPYKNINI